MKEQGACAKLVVLDASRRNPYERRFRTFPMGSRPISAPDNALILTSATPGKVADDGRGEHSVLVSELLTNMKVQPARPKPSSTRPASPSPAPPTAAGALGLLLADGRRPASAEADKAAGNDPVSPRAAPLCVRCEPADSGGCSCPLSRGDLRMRRPTSSPLPYTLMS